MNAGRRKRLTILHSNDMHGDLVAEARGAEGRLIGGLARISGYLKQVRQEERNVLYVIAGDMVQGSMIDLEYKGISTIEVTNYLAPDVATIGNHEFEYGLLHLLFLERVANFPLINANIYLGRYNKRLLRPYIILEVDGILILFIGVITDEVLQTLKKDGDLAGLITLEDPRDQVGRICNAYREQDVDLTVLLTHIGFEADKQLAASLDPAWGVDLIIGGHSHTLLERPAEVNGVLIVQAGVGTDQIGRFDLLVDEQANRIVEWQWRLLPVDEKLAEADLELQAFIDSFREVVDRKYNTLLTRFARRLTHPSLYSETELGNLLVDVLAARAQTDFAFFANFAVRGDELGPLVTLGEFRTALPYDDQLLRVQLYGAQIKRLLRHTLRAENRAGAGYFFQVNRGVRVVYDENRADLATLTLNGQPVEDERSYSVCIQSYHYDDTLKHFDLPQEQVTVSQVVATSMRDVFEEYLSTHSNLDIRVEGRIGYCRGGDDCPDARNPAEDKR